MRQNEIRSLNREPYFKFSGKFEIRGLILGPCDFFGAEALAAL